MNRMLNKVLKHLVQFILFVIVCWVLLMVSDEVARQFGNANWDAMAFTGAIIGGALTLLGVRIAIRNQRKDDFVQRFPTRLKNLDDLIEEMNAFQNSINSAIQRDDFKSIGSNVLHWHTKSDEIRQMGITADVRAYDETVKFTGLVDKWKLMMYENKPPMSNDEKFVYIKQQAGELDAIFRRTWHVKQYLLKRYQDHIN